MSWLHTPAMHSPTPLPAHLAVSALQEQTMLNKKHMIAAALLATSWVSHAGVITGVTASTNLGSNFGSNIANIVSGAGLT